MKEGRLYYDKGSNRFDIRFDSGGCYGGLHCGKCLEVRVDGEWLSTCIEYSCENSGSTDSKLWYLVGLKTKDLNGLKARI